MSTEQQRDQEAVEPCWHCGAKMARTVNHYLGHRWCMDCGLSVPPDLYDQVSRLVKAARDYAAAMGVDLSDASLGKCVEAWEEVRLRLDALTSAARDFAPKPQEAP